jgi:hypothetical protein
MLFLSKAGHTAYECALCEPGQPAGLCGIVQCLPRTRRDARIDWLSPRERDYRSLCVLVLNMEIGEAGDYEEERIYKPE